MVIPRQGRAFNPPLMCEEDTSLVRTLLRQYWPLPLAILLFAAMSYGINTNADLLQTIFAGRDSIGAIMLFLALGVVVSMIPWASTLPFIPLGVALWGWPITSILMLAIWVIGGHVLFEVVRLLHYTRFASWLNVPQAQAARRLVENRNVVHSALLRFVVEGDVMSFAYASFSHIGRWEYFRLSLLATIPTAIVYTYVGSLSWQLQLAAALLVVLMLLGRWLLKREGYQPGRAFRRFWSRFLPTFGF